MNGLEDAYDDFMRERKLRLAQLKGSADFFERRLLRSHPGLRPKRGGKLLNLLREKRPGGKKNGGNPPEANAQ